MRKLICALSLLSILSIGQDINAQRKIQVLSAVVKDKKIEGAEVLLQKNGERTVVGRTDRNGNVELSPLFADDRDAVVIIKKDGYSTLVAKCPCEGLTYAISPVMKNLDGMRIVLSWGEYPYDLDSHLWYSDQHIFWRQKVGRKANLDVDDTDSYGPETITIEEKKFGTEYIYAVHDYTNKEDRSSYELSNSSAKVFVYIGNSLVKTYYVPTNIKGNLWTVFKVTKEGEIEDVNSMNSSTVYDPGEIRYDMNNSLLITQTIDKQEALRLNRIATEEYKAQNYKRAIELYLAAIELYADFGQAYGNLGLSYKKNGQYAEALWANRKAIALANGNTASVTKAGAYYNIGRIYEERGEYAKAKEQYELAKSEVDRGVYDQAIKRMEKLID